ncbi:hypothetical protein ACI2VK_18090 [Ralstonia nicotianae]|uniref:hypothetical protein n=1 Tax=Ralstonia pseudosolanacearum TaxID=1310165 RepID=UPI000A5A2269|nr:hypothetical protein [Ralstonia pseudosolanacearum]MCK4155342.1 hypothetical protein [Ralstonia pseudosolanacearum]
MSSSELGRRQPTVPGARAHLHSGQPRHRLGRVNADANLTATAQIDNRNNHFATVGQTSADVHVTAYRLASTASAQQHDGMASY